VDVRLLETPQVDQRDVAIGELFALRLLAARDFETELDVRTDVEPRVERWLLEDDDALAPRLRDRPTVEQRFAFIRMIEAGDDVEQRRLPAAGRPDQADELTLADRQRNVVERERVVTLCLEVPPDVAQHQQLSTRRRAFYRRRRRHNLLRRLRSLLVCLQCHVSLPP
jgi:hypothetical protein